MRLTAVVLSKEDLNLDLEILEMLALEQGEPEDMASDDASSADEETDSEYETDSSSDTELDHKPEAHCNANLVTESSLPPLIPPVRQAKRPLIQEL